MEQITAIIIAKNEEEKIVGCIESLSFCSDILVIDNGSNDKTLEIAKRCAARVIQYISEDFADLRNKGLEEAKTDWIFYIDADERVSEELQRSILQAVLKGEKDAYKVKRKNYYYRTVEWPYMDFLERLFKKSALRGWFGRLHESPQINGSVGVLDGFLLHYTRDDIAHMVEKTIEWSKLEAQLRLEQHHPKMTWWRFPRVMCTAFFNSYIRQKGYSVGTAGLIESMYQSFSMFITYARLWEMQQKGTTSRT